MVQRIIHTEILKQRSCTSCPAGAWYRDLAQVVLEDPDTSGPKASWYEILCKWSYRILIQVVQKDPYTEMIQRSCTSANAGSWYKWSKGSSHRDPETEILHKLSHDLDTEISHKCAYRILIQWAKRSCHRDLAQVLLQDPDASGPKDHTHRDPETEILHKLSHRILIQISCTSGPRGSWYSGAKDPDRDLVQVLLQNRDTSGPKDPHTEILHKLSHRILIQRSRTSAPTGSWYSGPKDPATEILHKCSYRILIQAVQRLMHTEILKQRSCTSCLTGSWYRDLAQVVLEVADTSSPKASWYEILCKWSYRILIQVVQKDPYTEMIQRSCTSANAGSWYKWPKGSSHRDPETEILHKLSHDLDTEISHKWAYTILIQWAKRSCYRDLAQVLLQDPDTSGPKDHSHRDPETEILHKWSHRILIQRSCTSGPRGSWHKRFESILIRDLVQVVL